MATKRKSQTFEADGNAQSASKRRRGVAESATNPSLGYNGPYGPGAASQPGLDDEEDAEGEDDDDDDVNGITEDYSIPIDPNITPQKAKLLPTEHRSARRKAVRQLIQKAVDDDSDFEGDDDVESRLRTAIYYADAPGQGRPLQKNGLDPSLGGPDIYEIVAQADQDGVTIVQPASKPGDGDAPVKRGRGRPRGTHKKESPPPPSVMEPQERYFYQNRPNAVFKTSANTIPPEKLLSHASYHSAIAQVHDRHEESYANLHAFHADNFPLWAFELSQQYSLCLYGYGSKRDIVSAFADHLHEASTEKEPIRTLIVDAFHPDFTFRSILVKLAQMILPVPLSRLPTQPNDLVPWILECLRLQAMTPPIYIFINCIHSPALTKPAFQSLLAIISSHPKLHLIATADNPVFPLLWDSSMRETYNWIFHDTTTFMTYDEGQGTGEIGGVVDSINELLGRKETVGKGREGVRWLLRSLPENARSLFRILVSEILTLISADDEAGVQDDQDGDDEEDDHDEAEQATKKRRAKETELPSIDSKFVYQKASEEFVCNSEMAFRQLLKEFYDHRMVFVGHNAVGGETLGVNMRREDLEAVLEDLI